MRIGPPAGSRLPDPAAAPTEVRVDDLVRYLERAAATIVRHEVLLDRLDAALGDGDHGANMVMGFESVTRAPREARAAGGPADIGDLLRLVGHTLVSSVSGASAPLYGTAFIEARFVLAGVEWVDLGGLANGFEVARGALARRGLALRLGERSRGHQDPGATSCFLLVRAMADPAARRRPLQ